MNKLTFNEIKVGDEVYTSGGNMTVTYKSPKGERHRIRGIDHNQKEWTLPGQYIYKKEK